MRFENGLINRSGLLTYLVDALLSQCLSCMPDDRSGADETPVACAIWPHIVKHVMLSHHHSMHHGFVLAIRAKKRTVNIIVHTRTRAWHAEMMLSENETAAAEQVRISFFGDDPEPGSNRLDRLCNDAISCFHT